MFWGDKMVQAIIDINDDTNRVLNMVKAKFSLRDKSAAIEMMAKEYRENMLEPELRPEFIAATNKTMKQKPIYVGTADEFRKRYGVKKP